MFENLTDRAKRVIISSRDEAEKNNSPLVETEHILIGLLRERSGIAAEIIKEYGINSLILIKKIRGLDIQDENLEMTEDTDIPQDKTISMPTYSLTAKRVFEYTYEETKLLGAKSINTEHILLGLLRERRGKAFAILTKLGIDYSTVKEKIKNNIKTQSYQNDTPLLDEHGFDMTKAAREGKIDEIIGREIELDRLVQTLCRRIKNNAILLGEPGVGKTAIMEGLAIKIASGDVPSYLKTKRVVSVDMGSIIAGTKYRGQFEERLGGIIKEIELSRNIIIFIDEIHTLVGAGAAEGAIDASNMLKPALARGSFQCIGATTPNEYRKYIEKDPALERRFQTVIVDEPNTQDTKKILKGIKQNYESFHKINISDKILDDIIFLSNKYIVYKRQPDKSVDIMDEACARMKIEYHRQNKDITGLDEDVDIDDVQKEMLRSYSTGVKLEEKISSKAKSNEELNLTYDYVAQVVSHISNIPVRRLIKSDNEMALSIEENLKKGIIGQDDALHALAQSIKRSYAGLNDPERPIGSFIFLGPTGVGKTESVKRLAYTVFGREDSLVRIDMSEYKDQFNVTRLIGSPPGYVGHEEGGKLTEQIRKKPYCVVLFDEIEKANPDVLNILLQILDEGYITDSLGNKVSFRNTIIVLTSNLGMKSAFMEKNLGFHHSITNSEVTKYRSSANEALKRFFTPEFLNRIDKIVHFKPLGMEELKKILELQMENLNSRLKILDKNLSITDEAKDLLLSYDYNMAYGARPLKRLIQEHIEDPISDKLLSGVFSKRKNLKISVKNGKILIS